MQAIYNVLYQNIQLQSETDGIFHRLKKEAFVGETMTLDGMMFLRCFVSKEIPFFWKSMPGSRNEVRVCSENM